MLPIDYICVPPINPAIADKTVIANWIIFFQTLPLRATTYQFIKVETRPRRRYTRKRKLSVRKQNLPVQRPHS